MIAAGHECPTCGAEWEDVGAELRCPNGHVFTREDLDAARRNGTVLDGAAILEAVYGFLGRFVAYPSEHAHVAHTLWIVHAHLMDAWETTPRIAFLSPEPGSGKTRALEITETLVPRPVEAVNVTAAYLFRKVADPEGKPTILFDEIDTVFGPKAKENEDIRGLLNAGHRIGAVAGRCVVRGKTVLTEEIPAYCAVALAGLGGLPDTILSRSVVVRMRRRAPGERVEPYRRRLHAPEGNKLRDRLARWCCTVADVADSAEANAEMPPGVEDRDADVWEPLLTVATLAGGDWPERARVAAVALVALSQAATPSLGIRLLADIREVFGDKDRMSTDSLLEELLALDEAPWAEIAHGKPLNARGLAQRLRAYGVQSKTVRIGMLTPRGYLAEDFADPWARYLPPPGLSPIESATSATPQQASESDPLGPSAYESATSATAQQMDAGAAAAVCDFCGRANDPTSDVADFGKLCAVCAEQVRDVMGA